ncbi:MAG: mandelate racemase/muconate lactonizing enzyme family protein, partial [Betaproteobacteria bacterium]
ELCGRDIADVRMRLATYPHSPGGLVASAAKSAIEQALLDAEGRSRGVPAWQLLGARRRDRVPVYANINRATTDRTPERCARAAQAALAQGFRAVKIAPFDGVLPDALDRAGTQQAIDLGIERVRAIRAAIGAAPGLMVDCHWRFDPPTAHAVLERLADARLHWFECPVSEHPGCHDALAALRVAANAAGVKVAACELQTSVAGFRPFVAPRRVDVIMPDVKYAGGMAEMVRIAAFAQAHGVGFSPHNPTGPVGTYASLHAAAAAGQCESLELQVGESELYFDVVGGARPDFVDGAFVVPDTPGLGVTLDAAVLAARPWKRVPAGLDERLG